MSRATSTRSTTSPSSGSISGNYDQAAVVFDEVERQHPYSIWARRAQLMSAFSYYAAKDYTKAIDSARRFLSIHPGNRDAPYAYYLIALSYYEQINDVEPRPGDHPAGARFARRADPPLSRHALCRRRAAEGRPGPRPSRRQGDGGRPLLPASRRSGWRRRSASAPSSTSIRPPATRPRRWSG